MSLFPPKNHLKRLNFFKKLHKGTLIIIPKDLILKGSNSKYFQQVTEEYNRKLKKISSLKLFHSLPMGEKR